MPMPSRTRWALGLTLTAMVAAGIPGPALGQAQTPAQSGGQPPAATRPAAAPLRIGSIDMEQVFKGYKKVEFTSNQLKSDAQAKQAELGKLLSQMQQLGEEMKGLAPGSNDFTAKESEVTRLRATLEAEREQAQTEFARREAEALAQIYREVQDMSAAVAKANGMQYVVKVSNEPITGSDPNSVMAAMARSVVYSDPSLDITQVVIKYLNQRYESSGATGATAPPADPATQPASATQATPRPAATGAVPGSPRGR